MSARTIAMRLGLVALAGAQIWCASEEDPTTPPPASDAGADTGAPVDAGPSDGDAAVPEVPACTDRLCRVALPEGEAVALDGIWAKSASDVWVVGSNGYAARFDGTSWRRIATGTKATIFAVAGSSDGTVWGASGGQSFLLLDREADGGVEVVDGGFKGVVRAIATFGERQAWAVGDTFASFEFPPPPSAYIWRYGPGADGGPWAWQPVSPPCPEGEFGQANCMKLRGVWAESAERQWFVGDDGKVFRTTASGGSGDELQLEEMNSSSLRRLEAVWGFGANDVWAVGAQGVIRHFTGGDAWTAVASPVLDDLHAVWGSRPDDVWAVGDDGVVLHWDGTAWSVVSTPYGAQNRPRLYAVGGSGSDVWIAGEATLLRSKAPGTGGDQ